MMVICASDNPFSQNDIENNKDLFHHFWFTIFQIYLCLFCSQSQKSHENRKKGMIGFVAGVFARQYFLPYTELRL